ncbi:hypothetical protein NQ317_005462, partial [Molorchus minor]
PQAPSPVYAQEAISVQEEDTYDVAFLSTTAPLPTTQKATILDGIKSSLPWLSSILNPNGTINILSGTYDLGLDHVIGDKPECSNAPQNSTGICTLLHKCPKVYPELKNEQVYQKFFCDLNGYAGVCCPKEENKN